MLELEPAMIYRLDVAGPLTPSRDENSDARHQFWSMARATLDGPRIKASTPMSGIDWFTPHSDGFGRPHVRLPFRTDDGAIVLLEYHGIVHATDAFNTAVESNTATQWDDQYMRMALMFDTAASRYRWLTQNLFVARGRLLAAKTIEYDVYRVR